MAYTWAKVYIEILDDHKMGMLQDGLWRRVIELILLAKKNDKDGWLPGMIEMAWALRVSTEQLEADLEKLAEIKIVEVKDGGWYLTNFVKRQAAEPVIERVRNFRKRSVAESCNDSETQSYQTKTRLDTDKDTDKTSGAVAPTKKSTRYGLRFDASPEGALMAQKLRAVYESNGRRTPEFYENAMQRDAYLMAFKAIGGRIASLLDSAMEKNITNRGRLLSWLQACAKNNGNGKVSNATHQRDSSDDEATRECAARINARNGK